jgi:hydroxymethylbilane synthase
MTVLATLRLGTRGSRLALAQTQIAQDALLAAGFAGPIEVVPIRTRGDALSERRPGGRWELTDGQFTTDLERRLLAGEVDMVVHSYKDLPTVSDAALAIGAVLERGDARDALLTPDGGGLDDLRFGGRVATSSTRRAAQLAALRPDLVAVPIRGNVESRLGRLERHEFDGLLLAAVGLQRLGIEVAPAALLPFEVMLPAPAQAALAIQVRADDTALRDRLGAIDHQPSRVAVEAERALLAEIGGGCLAPLGALGEIDGERLRLRAAYEARDGRFARVDAEGPAEDWPATVARAASGLREAVA